MFKESNENYILKIRGYYIISGIIMCTKILFFVIFRRSLSTNLFGAA